MILLLIVVAAMLLYVFLPDKGEMDRILSFLWEEFIGGKS